MRTRRTLVWSSVVIVLILLAGLAAGGWYYSDQLLPAPADWQPSFDVEVLASDEAEGALALAVEDGDLVDLGAVGFVTEDGLVLLEGAVERTARGVVRRGTLVAGDWPTVGEFGGASVDAFEGDPATTLHLPFDTVEVTGDLGPLPAWRVVPSGAATDETWVVIAHGRSARKSEGNRALATVVELGLPSLVIAVRNDDDAVAAPDGYGRYGEAEWLDLRAAIDHLRRVEDAQRFVLIGYSQGGSLVLSYLRRSPNTEDVDAAVLVSPLVSLHDTLVLQAQQRDIPEPVIAPLLASTRLFTSVRSGMELHQVEHLDQLADLPTDIPLLATAGDADVTIPIGPTRALAAARPDQVTYEEFAGAGHVREWNMDRARFDAALTAFLDEHVARPLG